MILLLFHMINQIEIIQIQIYNVDKKRVKNVNIIDMQILTVCGEK